MSCRSSVAARLVVQFNEIGRHLSFRFENDGSRRKAVDRLMCANRRAFQSRGQTGAAGAGGRRPFDDPTQFGKGS
jgi:hypothetical protein